MVSGPKGDEPFGTELRILRGREMPALHDVLKRQWHDQAVDFGTLSRTS
jgi:hypothetical protein